MKFHQKKGLVLILLILVLTFAFPDALQAQSTKPASSIAKIEVVYFHAPNRCPSCVATETQTKQVLEKLFKAEMSKSLVSFVSLDLKEDKNEALVEKYEIVFPTLLILQKQGEKEVKTDFSGTAFQYAYTEPEKYEKLLQAEIHNQLKSK